MGRVLCVSSNKRVLHMRTKCDQFLCYATPLLRPQICTDRPTIVAAAEDNHASMIQSSVLETVVLLLVGIGQIIFVRKWFSGKGTLLKQWA